MAYIPSLKDLPPDDNETSLGQGYTPSLRDIGGPDPVQKFEPYEASFGEKLAPNILTGLAEAGHGIINFPHNLVNLVSPKLASYIPKQQNYDFGSLLNMPVATLSDKLIRGLTQYAPSMLMPAASAETFLGRLAANAAPQAAFGATQNENPLVGGAEGAVAGAIAPLFSALRLSRMFRGHLPAEELARNAEALKGTTTGLGRAIESPTLNRLYENILPYVIGSGAEKKMQKTASDIVKKGGELLENVRGDIEPGHYGIKLQDALKKSAKEAKEEKEQGFRKLNEEADKIGLKVGRENFSNEANNILQEINQSPELLRQADPKMIQDLKEFASNKEGNNLKLSNIFRGKIGDKANEYYMTPGKTHEYGVYSRLKDALKNDIDESFEKSGNQELKNIYAKNQKDYAEKYAPFEHPDIVKFTRQGGDPDLLLSHFIRRGPNDRAYLLSRLTQKLNPQESQLPLYGYLSKSIEDGEVNPIKLSQLYRDLGENQRKALIKDGNVRKQIENYSNLVGKNKEAFNLMFNPKTGARNTELLVKFGQMLGGTAAGGIPGLAATTIGGGLTGRLATHLLTSPKFRDKLIDAMIKNQPIFKTNLLAGGTEALANEEGNK